MRILTVVIIAIMLLVLVGMASVRFATIDPAAWHQRPVGNAPGDRSETGGFLAVRQMTASPEQVLKGLEVAALATPRTTLIAGSVAEGMMTFQTRSAFWGFPDYTTITVEGDLLIIYGRLRFGRSDLGVNRARIIAWLQTITPLTAPL